MKKNDEYSIARRVLMAEEVEGGYEVDRTQVDGVEVALGNEGMTVKAARQCTKDRKEGRALVHM